MKTRTRFLQTTAITAAIFGLGGMLQGAGFNLPFYEPFPSGNAGATGYNGYGYENQEELGQSVTEPNGAISSSAVWTFGNSISSSCARIETTNGQAGLEYPGLTNVDYLGSTSQTGLLATYQKDTGSVKNRAAVLNIPTNTPGTPMAIYASCLINIQTNTFTSATDPYPFFGLTTNTSGSSVNQAGAVVYIADTNGFQLQISKNANAAAPATVSITSNNTYLIVLRYNYSGNESAGVNDSVDLWVNPTALGSNVTVPPPTISTTNNNNLSSNFFGAVAIFENPNPCFMYIDEIRVATNWGGVTPTNPPAGTTYTVTGGGSGCGEAGFSVGLSGSDTNVTYYLYTNWLPSGISVNGTGSAISFGEQSASGLYTVLASNDLTTNESWMSGSAVINLSAAPTISSQPVSMSVPAGELGCFTVISTGGGQTYQWYKGGSALTNGNEFSGAQSSNLVIFPVGAQDVGSGASGYYVVISNTCGTSIQSSTVGLSLGSPANLEWYGDGIANLWDVRISENWNTNTAFFNYGDNVTFDDNSPNPTVTLNNSFLSPSTITINGSANNYVFTGPGGLAGSGSILMNSSASLTLGLGLNNNETGGIVISNGTLNFNQAQNLGSGVITLAGGQLAGANVGLIDIDNVIDVTSTNSAIGVNESGGQNLFVTNILQGTSGNLTFVNNTTKTATPEIILEYPSFTFGLPVTLNPGGGGVILSGENTSGIQEWTNVISGGGEIQRQSAGGETLLDDTNTYSGGTILTAGILGVASDSIISFGQLISGPLGTGTLYIDTRGGTPSTGNPEILAARGPHFIGNAVAWYSNAVGNPFVITGTNELIFGGPVDLMETNRVIDVDNSATLFTNAITDDGYGMGIVVNGTGALYLDGANLYTGGTTNYAALLAGNGSVQGPVVVEPGGALGAGDPSGIGTFTINNNLTIDGNISVRVNNSGPTNDNINVTGGVTNLGAGTVTVNNVGSPLSAGNRFVLFNQPVVGGAALTVAGAGVNWNNHLAIDGSISVASVIPPQSPQFTSVSITGGNLVFTGTNGTSGYQYVVQASTNLINWTPVLTNSFGSGGSFSSSLPVGGAPSKFYRIELQSQ